MEEIKVNEYVRTDNGIIGKYTIKQNINYIDTGKQFIGFDIENDIVKHSPNIIDLIEEGDFITLTEPGYPVLITGIWTDGAILKEKESLNIEINNNQIFEDIKNDKDFTIYSIVTKEQFNQVKYEV